MARKFPTQNQLKELEKINQKIKDRGGNVKVITQGNKKVNEKANKTANIKSQLAKSGVAATWEAAQRQHENKARQEFGISKQETKKIDSNPVKSGKTRIGNLARPGRGGAGGGGFLDNLK